MRIFKYRKLLEQKLQKFILSTKEWNNYQIIIINRFNKNKKRDWKESNFLFYMRTTECHLGTIPFLTFLLNFSLNIM